MNSDFFVTFFAGSYTAGQDIHCDQVNGSTTSNTWNISELGMMSGIQYYTSVKAINMAGLEAVAHGDGFIVSIAQTKYSFK